MPIAWTIAGQTGKPLGPAQVSLESLRVSNARVTFRNLATDTFTFSLALSSLTGSGDTIPALAQTVSLYRAGSKFFQGVVTGARQVGWRIDITVSGPWWWFERIALESTQTDASGAAGDRASWALPEATLELSLYILLARLVALGVPMTISGLAETFTAPEMKVNQGSFAQAIAEVVRVTPDMVFFFDYSGSVPRARSVRRLSGMTYGTAADLTLDARTLADFELNPMTELEVVGVRVPYLTRAANGAKRFAIQAAGTTVVGKVLLHTVSGDEMDTFLPNDLLDYVDVKTMSSIPNIDAVMRFDPFIAQVVSQFGWASIGLTAPSLDMWEGQTGVNWYSRKIVQTAITPGYTDESGNSVAGSGRNLLIGGDLPEWALKQMRGVKVKCSGTLFGYLRVQYQTAPVFQPNQLALRQGATTGIAWASAITGPTSVANYVYWYERPWAFSAILIEPNYTALTRVYRASDYAFRLPASGFAAGLLAAQNYIPYEGRCTVVEDDAGSTRYIDRALNFSNSQTAHASIRAMVTEETVELGMGKTSIYMGPPARFSFLELVNKMRTNSNDQITYL